MARSITLSAQLANKFAERCMNKTISKLLKEDEIKDRTVYMDTDSVAGNTLINVNGKYLTIEQYYDNIRDEFIKFDIFNEDYVKTVNDNHITPSLNKSGYIENKKIKYIMKHKVKKVLYKITNSKGDSVTVTEDHSIIVKNKKTGNIRNISPVKLDPKKHYIINICVRDTDRRAEENFITTRKKEK